MVATNLYPHRPDTPSLSLSAPRGAPDSHYVKSLICDGEQVICHRRDITGNQTVSCDEISQSRSAERWNVATAIHEKRLDVNTFMKRDCICYYIPSELWCNT